MPRPAAGDSLAHAIRSVPENEPADLTAEVPVAQSGATVPAGPMNRVQTVEPRPASTVGPRAVGVSVDTSDDADEGVLEQPAVDDLELQMNTDVLRWVNFFTGAGRSNFERWLKRSGRYMELFRNVLTREGLPPDLVHLVFVESGFNLQARSVSHAVGPWQFLRRHGADVRPQREPVDR